MLCNCKFSCSIVLGFSTCYVLMKCCIKDREHGSFSFFKSFLKSILSSSAMNREGDSNLGSYVSGFAVSLFPIEAKKFIALETKV